MSGVALAQPGMKNNRDAQDKPDRTERIAERLELDIDQHQADRDHHGGDTRLDELARNGRADDVRLADLFLTDAKGLEENLFHLIGDLCLAVLGFSIDFTALLFVFGQRHRHGNTARWRRLGAADGLHLDLTKPQQGEILQSRVPAGDTSFLNTSRSLKGFNNNNRAVSTHGKRNIPPIDFGGIVAFFLQ